MSTAQQLKIIISAQSQRADKNEMGMYFLAFEKPAHIERYTDVDGWRVTLSLYRPTSANGGWVIRKAQGRGKHDRDVRIMELDGDVRAWAGYDDKSNKAIDALFVARQQAIDAEVAKAREGE